MTCVQILPNAQIYHFTLITEAQNRDITALKCLPEVDIH